MALLSRQDASGLTGATVTPVGAAGGGDTLAGGQGVHLYVENGSGGSLTVTLTTPETVEGSLAVADRTFTVADGAFRIVPIPSRYNDPSTGVASVGYSTATSVNVAAILCRSAA